MAQRKPEQRRKELKLSFNSQLVLESVNSQQGDAVIREGPSSTSLFCSSQKAPRHPGREKLTFLRVEGHIKAHMSFGD